MLRQIERSAIKRLAERGQSQRAIAQELDDSRMTVALALAEPIEQVPAKRERTSIADPYRPQIERWLEAGLAAVRMLELARSDPEPAVPGGRSVFSEAVRPVRAAPEQAMADVPPGDETSAIDQKRSGPLSQRPEAARHIVAPKYGPIAIGEDREGQLKLVEQLAGFRDVVRHDTGNLHPAPG